MGKLSPAEREIYEAIRDLLREGKTTSNDDVAKYLVKSKDTVKTHKTRIYAKLGITGNDDEKMAKLLKRIDEGIDDSKEGEVVNTPRSTGTRWAWAILFGVIVFIVVLYVERPQTYLSEPTPTKPLSTTEPSATGSTEGQGGINLTDTPPLPTFTPVLPTFTPISPTFTPAPTNTLAPTETSTPAVTVTPESPILYEDSFDTILNSQVWTAIQGEAYTYNGYLTTDNSSAILSIGQKDWTNYIITFDILEMSCYNFSDNPFVGVRADDLGNYLAFTFSDCEIAWNISTNGNHQRINATFQSIQSNLTKMEVVVNGVNFQGLSYPPYASQDFPQGKILIKLRGGMKIDNLKITRTP